MNQTLEAFQRLAVSELAAQVKSIAPQVCALSLRGTRRARYQAAHHNQPAVIADQQSFAVVNPYSMIFEHGIDTLLVPLNGPNLSQSKSSTADFAALAARPDFLDLYDRLQVRVRFYGDYRHYFTGTPHAYLIDLFDRLAERTRRYNRHRLFFGLFAADSAETLAGLSLRHFQKHGHMPDRPALITMYYGEYVEPVSLVLAVDPYNSADIPLLAAGDEEFYIIHGGLAGLTQRRLRHILYDHLSTREAKSAEPLQVDASNQDWLYDFSTAPADLWSSHFESESIWSGD